MTADADKKFCSYVDGYNAGFKHGQQKLHKQVEELKDYIRKIRLYAGEGYAGVQFICDEALVKDNQ